MGPRDGKTLWEIFSSTAETFGRNCAVEEGNVSIDYTQLLSLAQSFSGFLKASAGQNPFIVSLLPAGINYVVTSLATLSAGKIVVVIHDSYTRIQVEKCLATLNHPLVVSTLEKWESLSGITHSLVHLIPDEFDLCASIESSPRSEASAEGESNALEGVGYCFFTSGSTGDSKAVLVTETVIKNSVEAVMATEPSVFNPSMRGLMAVTNSFIPSMSDVWTVFFSGGTLCIPPAKIKLDMDKFRFWIRDQRITTATFATPVMELLLQKDVDQLESLRLVTFGGTLLNPNRFNFKQAKFNAYHIYGGTEFMLGTLGKIPRGTEVVSASVGRPIFPLKFYILDEAGAEVLSPEVRGEIHIGGPPASLMRGYYGQPEQTAKVLIPNPFDPELSPMYRTGDCGYWASDGNLFVVGRNDEQVKIHGMRLELGEIENALSCFPGILQAVAIVREVKGNKQIWAFCTLAEGVTEEPRQEEIEEFLIPRLQRHAIPGTIRFMNELPRTPTGKISRFALREIPNDGSESSSSGKGTGVGESDLMRTVRAVWAEALALLPHSLKPTANFFYIGGNSILAFKVTGLLRKAEPGLGDLDPLLLFKFPVLKDFVEALSQTENFKPEASRIDFAAEIELPLDFPVGAYSEKPGILITGTTGYLGPLLLMDALKEYSDKTFYCLIRAKSDEEARKRLEATLDAYFLRHHFTGLERVHCIGGDLAKPKFGLDDLIYGNLLESVGRIFHAAAEVSFLKTYEQLRETTVAMTKNILLFAKEGSSTELHYMSTIGVFDGGVFDGVVDSSTSVYEALERRIPAEVIPDRMVNAYFQSKWVSEQLVWAAANGGLRASIYRIGQVGAQTVTKGVNRTDALAGFIIACQKLGVYPTAELRLPFVDADVSRTIIALSKVRDLASDHPTSVFHLVGTEVGIRDFFSGREEDPRPVGLEEWEAEFEKSSMAELKAEDDINAWLFLQMVKQAEETCARGGRSLMKNISFSDVNTLRAAGDSMVRGIQPRLYADLLISQAKSN